MKIAHIITRLIIGGAQENTLLTCEGLHQRGHDVTLIAGPETGPEGSLWPRAEAGGYNLNRLDSLVRNVRPLSDLRCLYQLTGLLKSKEVDVVHTHSSKAGILGRRAAAAARVPCIVHTIHGMSFNRTQSAMTQALYRTLERMEVKHTHAFVSVADAMTREAVAAGIGSPDCFTTIRSGMEIDTFGPNPEMRQLVRGVWGVSDNDIVVGTVARLFRHKGYERLLEAMPCIADESDRIHFVWIGDGAQRDEYLKTLDKLGLRHRVHLTGLVPPHRIPELMTGFDLLVHASDWEGLPRAVVQALLTGVAVVCFDNDGSPEVVKTGETGILIPFGDSAALADAILRLSADPPLRARLGAEGRARCRAMFDHRTMVEQIEALYLRLQSCTREPLNETRMTASKR